MIEVKNVSFAYGKAKILKGLNLKLKPGKLYAVIGPNGSGKTTLIKLLSAQGKPAEGELFLDEKPYKAFGRKEFAKKVALLPQGRNTPDISVYDLVCHGRYPYLDFTRKMAEADITTVAVALKATDTESFAERNVKRLSGGERQRVYMAMLYAQDTPYVLLDEPTTHLDISYQFQIMHTLEKMKSEGKCVVAVLHELSMALKYADEIILMSEGRIVSVASPQEMVESGNLDRIFGVECHCVEANDRKEYVFSDRSDEMFGNRNRVCPVWN